MTLLGGYCDDGSSFADAAVGGNRVDRGGSGKDDGSGGGGTDLLSPFYPLLPPRYRRKIETMACEIRFEQSAFRRMCASALTQEENGTIGVTVSALMIGPAGGGPQTAAAGISREAMRSYLNNAQRVAAILLRCHSRGDKTVQTEALILMFLSLMPPRHCTAVREVIREIRAGSDVKRMKEVERSREGEAGVDASLFRGSSDRVPPRTRKDPSDADEDQEQREERRDMEEALMRAEQINLTRKANVKMMLANKGKERTTAAPRAALRNPYAATGRQQRCTGTTLSSNPIGVQGDAISRGVIGHRRANFASASHRPSKRARATHSSILENHENITDDDTMVRDSCAKEKGIARGKDGSKFKEPHLSQLDPLDRCLRQVETDVYIKATPRIVRVNRNLKQNVPMGHVCTICKSPSEKVSIFVFIFVNSFSFICLSS